MAPLSDLHTTFVFSSLGGWRISFWCTRGSAAET